MLCETKSAAWDWFRRKGRGQKPSPEQRVLRRQHTQTWVHLSRKEVSSHTDLAWTSHPLLLAFNREQCVPGIQMPPVNRQEALMDGCATIRNGSMYHLTRYWHSQSERRHSGGLTAWIPALPVGRTFPRRYEDCNLTFLGVSSHHGIWTGVVVAWACSLCIFPRRPWMGSKRPWVSI